TVRAWTESDMTTLQPIEAVEQLYPVRIERTALREDSGGPGRWRGGLGLTREVRIQARGTQLSVLAEKSVLPPFGVCGGGAGAARLGVTLGAVVELVNPRGAPLRAWVVGMTATHRDGATPVAELAPIALRMLALADGAEAEVRTVHSGVLSGEPSEVAGPQR